MKPSAIVLDLDGTLIDSRCDIADAVNEMRMELHLEPLPIQQVVACVGNGIRKLVERTLADDSRNRWESALPLMRECYQRHLTQKTCLYEGVADGLRTLKNAGIPLALFSNKPEDFCRTILAHFKLLDLFSVVIGGGSSFPMKPNPEALIYILDGCSAVPGNAWILGDSQPDLDAGINAHMKTALASYGFGTANPADADLILSSFPQFTEMMLS